MKYIGSYLPMKYIGRYTKRRAHEPKVMFELTTAAPFCAQTCGQSYKASTIVIYDTRVVPDLKIPHITTLVS